MVAKKGRRQSRAADTGGGAIQLGSMTHVGMKRSGNEDAQCALIGANSPGGSDAVLAVADGMGGHQSGEVASAMAIKGLLTQLSNETLSAQTNGPASDYEATIREVVQRVNAGVHDAAASRENFGMGTTLTAAILVGSTLFIGHVGDSRAYLLRRGKLRQLTRDHSWVAEEVARGALPPEEAKHHPRRNVLTRALGISPTVDVDATAVGLKQGDAVLICSDGLYPLVSEAEMAQSLEANGPQEACADLVARANAQGGPDNITVVISKFEALSAGPKGSSSPGNLHKQTTVRVATAGSQGRGAKSALRVILLPIWLPLWLLFKLVKLPLWLAARVLRTIFRG